MPEPPDQPGPLDQPPHRERGPSPPCYSIPPSVSGSSSFSNRAADQEFADLCAGLRAALNRAWASGLADGSVSYDPNSAALRHIGAYRYLCIPGRSTRPRTKVLPPGVFGVLRPHEACIFDGHEFLSEREVLRFEFDGGRPYHVIANKFPVTADHFVVIRSHDDAPEKLTQSLLNAREVHEIIRWMHAIGPRYRVYFNSNRGRDGSSSGSSINHWHYQFLAYPGDKTPAEMSGPVSWLDGAESQRAWNCVGDTRVGKLSAWPAAAYVIEGSDDLELAETVWALVDRVIAEDRAYNLEACHRGDQLRFYLFPKTLGAPQEIAGVGELSHDFGGIEMSGDFVLPDLSFLSWFEEHVEEGERLTTARLAGTTRFLADDPSNRPS